MRIDCLKVAQTGVRRRANGAIDFDIGIEVDAGANGSRADSTTEKAREQLSELKVLFDLFVFSANLYKTLDTKVSENAKQGTYYLRERPLSAELILFPALCPSTSKSSQTQTQPMDYLRAHAHGNTHQYHRCDVAMRG